MGGVYGVASWKWCRCVGVLVNDPETLARRRWYRISEYDV